MADFPNKDSQFQPGQSGNPAGRPVGAISLATRIQRMLNDDEFTSERVLKDGSKVQFKGNPAEAIIRTAILRSMSGDKQWGEWLAKHGWGIKQTHEFEDSPINVILKKYGLDGEAIANDKDKPVDDEPESETKEGEKDTDAGETPQTS